MLLDSVVRFAEDTGGLEKTLRLFQGFCTIASGFAEAADDIAFWIRLRSQFALGRRYFRLLKWHPCWTNALRAIASDKPPLCTALGVAKWSFLGMYFFLEMFTISNAMGITAYDWGPKVQREANKCWFYALFFSILLSLYELLFPERPPENRADNMDGAGDEKTNGSTHKKTKAEKNSAAKATISRGGSTKIYTQLAIDLCDLFVPGAAVGWIPVGPIFVGTASTISTSLAGRQIWNRVQRNANRT